MQGPQALRPGRCDRTYFSDITVEQCRRDDAIIGVPRRHALDLGGVGSIRMCWKIRCAGMPSAAQVVRQPQNFPSLGTSRSLCSIGNFLGHAEGFVYVHDQMAERQVRALALLWGWWWRSVLYWLQLRFAQICKT